MQKYRNGEIFPGWFAKLAILFVLLISGCVSQQEEPRETLFKKISYSESNIFFSNNVEPDQTHNITLDNNFYSGGGVALGDINNDGLLDIYFTANQKLNKLYLNKGNFKFEDITTKTGVGGGKPWSTGVSMVDINGDGLLDIYVSNSGLYNGKDRKNELFINKGALTFSESAEEFGIADSGYSIHTAFFDYDNDGDLDMYLINNHAYQPIGAYDLANVSREEQDFASGDRLYRNDGGVLTDVTQQAGIYSSGISFGYGATVGDLNRDGWMDIYISNDFFERDYLYLNQGDGSFKEVLTEKLNSISTTSMSGDIADLNNDHFPEIYITDMLPEREERLKTITDFINWDQLQSEADMGYHYKFTRNTLHYNNSDGTFSEIGRYAGVEATDWSWGALIADFNLDGLRDIFVANGIYKDVTNKDYLISVTRGKLKEKVIKDGKVDFVKLTELISSTPLSNYLFKNEEDLQFINRSSEWGIADPGFSNGSAYGDLDNDGDLDLIVNNVNMKAFLYENTTSERYPDRSWVQLELKGQPPNTVGVGAQVKVVAGSHSWYVEQMPQRGFQSSVDPTLHVGLGTDVTTIDSIQVHWPSGSVSLKTDVKPNQRLKIQEAKGRVEEVVAKGFVEDKPVLLEEITDKFELNWSHEESDNNDFKDSPLLFHMRSTEGPPLCSGDMNGNGQEEVYVGGSAGQPGILLVQDLNASFIQSRQPSLEADRETEDTDCLFLDTDGDNRMELYVASGSSEFSVGNKQLVDRLYQMNGGNKLIRMAEALPHPEGGFKPTGTVQAADMDGDGDQDLFVGDRSASKAYGIPVGGRLLLNDGMGQFEDATDRSASQLRSRELQSAGITGAAWVDISGNGYPDLILAGEWMPLMVFYNREGRLERAGSQQVGLEETSGWWQSLELADLNGDGHLDLIAGNHGLNSRFKVSPEQPLEMWVEDFDRDGEIERVFTKYNNAKGPYPMALRHMLLQNLSYLKTHYPTYSSYAEQTITDIFTQEQLSEAQYFKAEQLASVVGWNRGDGSFQLKPLPMKAQWTPIYAILSEDLSGDQIPELVLGGNLEAVQPQAGQYDASHGIVLRQDSSGQYRQISSQESGFITPGEIRDFQTVVGDGGKIILVALNNDELIFFKQR